jgi:hypothetical protein
MEMVGKDGNDGWRSRTLWMLLLAVLLAAGVLAVCAAASDDAEAAGNKQITLYLHNVTPSKQVGNIATLRTMDTLQGTGPVSKTFPPTINSVKENWYLYPSLANDTTIEGEVTMYMWALRTVRMGDSDQVTLIYELYDVDGTGAKVARIARGIQTMGMVLDWRQYSVTNDSVGTYTVPQGHYLLVEFELQGSSSNWYELAWGDDNYRSKMVIETRDYLVVDAAEVRDGQGVARDVLFLDTDDKDITFWTRVIDPFGGYDLRFVNATLRGPGGRVIIDDVAMTKTSGYFTSYASTFELGWNYSGRPEGTYNLTVTAVDNSGYFYRFPSHPDDLTYGGHLEALSISFWIGGPPQPLDVTVLDNLTRPLQGSVVLLEDRMGVSDASGIARVWIANGTFDLAVYWQDVLVYEGPATVSGSTTVVVEARVFYPVFNVRDDLGDPLEDAVAIITHPNGTVLNRFPSTDGAGTFLLDRMAGGEYGISLLWRGAPVHEGRTEVSGNGPFQLDARVYTVVVSIVDDMGDPVNLAQVVFYNSTSNIVLDSRVTGPGGDTTTRLPLGSYDLEVYWRNTMVHDTTRDLLVNTSGEITLVATIYILNLTLVDTAGAPLVGSKVLVAYQDGSMVLDFRASDESATVSTRLAPSDYSIWVYWHDVLVNSTGELILDGHRDLTVVCDVFMVPVLVEDSMGGSLPSAAVSFEHALGQSFGIQVTGPEGNASIQLAAGDYGVQVHWADVLVLDDRVTISSAEVLVLRVAVHYLDVRVTDSHGLDLEGALVYAAVGPTGGVIKAARTDDGGSVILRLPIGEVLLSVTWMDSPVHLGMFVVEGEADLSIAAAVFWPTFTTVDSREQPLEGVQLTVANSTSGRTLASPVTDVVGDATARLPLGTYLVHALWKDHLVFDGTMEVLSDDPHVLACSVHYVDLHLLDSADVALEGAQVLIRDAPGVISMGDATTGADGHATLRLPAAHLVAIVSWQGVVVLETSLEVLSDGTHDLTTSVYYPEVRVLDSRGSVLENAEVALALVGPGTTFGLDTTGPEGTATFRVPGGSYEVAVRWLDTPVLATAIDVDRTSTHVLTAWVHYLSFHLVDSAGTDLDNATVVAINGTTGAVLGMGTTDAAGLLELRLPRGPCDVTTSWMSMTVHAVQGLPVVADANVPLVARVHYLTVIVKDGEGAKVRQVDVNVLRLGGVVSSALTDARGSAVFRLPEGLHRVDITYRTTDRLTAVSISQSKEADLTEATTLTFDLGDDDYPLPLGRTNLFYVILAIIVLIVITMLVTYLLKGRGREHVPAPDEAPDDGYDLLELELDEDEGRDPLKDLMGESEIEPEGDE